MMREAGGCTTGAGAVETPRCASCAAAVGVSSPIPGDAVMVGATAIEGATRTGCATAVEGATAAATEETKALTAATGVATGIAVVGDALEVAPPVGEATPEGLGVCADWI